MVMIMPAYAIHLSTRCRLSISFKTEFDRPTVFRTSKAFLWALCSPVKMDISRQNLEHQKQCRLIVASEIFCSSKILFFFYLKSVPLVCIFVKDSDACLVSFFKHTWGATSWLHCLGFVIKYSKDMWGLTILQQESSNIQQRRRCVVWC